MQSQSKFSSSSSIPNKSNVQSRTIRESIINNESDNLLDEPISLEKFRSQKTGLKYNKEDELNFKKILRSIVLTSYFIIALLLLFWRFYSILKEILANYSNKNFSYSNILIFSILPLIIQSIGSYYIAYFLNHLLFLEDYESSQKDSKKYQ
ncbi:hypothetical protein BVG19_g2921 [[Candida] boidinii]|nr:hypothetical protein BVG19_g2921 [[Candida] boidinii]OWB52018.1 hypothetical protein B5S27_g3589 [[Candida] boidinii]OWB66487.1 hypothetical protein B5S30_g1828 [[Candida] boidinii]